MQASSYEGTKNYYHQLKNGIVLKSREEMIFAGKALAEFLEPNSIVALKGDLGAGKTTFVQGLGLAWGIEGITSPTFNLLNIYEGQRRLLHLDAYRLKKEDDLIELCLEDWMVEPFCFAIEWPENLPKEYKENALWLSFEIKKTGQHFVRLSV